MASRTRTCIGPITDSPSGVCGNNVPTDSRVPFCSNACFEAKKLEGRARTAAQKMSSAQKKAAKAEAKATTKAEARTEICMDCRSERSCEPSRAHCDLCLPKHSNDLVVIIQPDASIVTFQDIQEAETALTTLVAALKVVVLLDLHGVTDTLDSTTPLGAAAAVVSYVGRHSTTRYDAEREIVNRIRAGQILFGALVFARGKRVKGKCIPTQEPGSKAWFCSRIPTARLFVDDSIDHVESVALLESGPASVLLNRQDDLLAVITNHLTC